KRGGIAFVTQHDPLYVGAGRFWDPGGTVRMESPLEVIALDNDGAGDLPIAPPLKLGPDVDEKRAALGGRIGICGLQPHQRRASRGKVLIQRARSHFMLKCWNLD
ncbi:MAG TPA: hypothetical protein VK747_13740, partial [Blastocatellia bacterium]|nr:hypothetical protein [Blastocatellia bacterium]